VCVIMMRGMDAIIWREEGMWELGHESGDDG
jgi:hypothetical protein